MGGEGGGEARLVEGDLFTAVQSVKTTIGSRLQVW